MVAQLVKLFPKLGRWLAAAVVALMLSGCIDYDLAIRFDSQTHGSIRQILRLDDSFVALNGAAREQWLGVFRQEAALFAGQVETLGDGTLELRIDFYSGADLVHTFNQLFSQEGPIAQVPGAPPLYARLELDQDNYGLALRNRLHLEIDLQALNPDSPSGGALDSWRRLNLGLELSGFRSRQRWLLQPGQINQIEAVCWVPSPIGIGAVIIVIACAAGYGLRYGLGLQPGK